MRAFTTPTKCGFSLVELSIVLVILGLLVGGILSGQALIHAAELRSVTTSINKYQAAMYSFRDKYFALPGDMANATAFWGTGAACPSNSTGGTCNGNGDGYIYCTPDYTGCEMTYASQHLAKAGLIEGAYNPNWPAASSVLSQDYVYITKMKGLGITPAYYAPYPAVNYNNYGNKTYLRAAKWLTGAYYSNYSTVAFSCEDTWNIDTKMDDGKPGTGIMVTPRNFCVTDTAGANYGTAAYAVNNTADTTFFDIAFQ